MRGYRDKKMKLISLFLVLAAEILTKRGHWLALVLIDSKYIKKGRGRRLVSAGGSPHPFFVNVFFNFLFFYVLDNGLLGLSVFRVSL
jgi:hypothetical protein